MTISVTAEHIYEERVEVVAAMHLAKYPNEYDPNVAYSSVMEKRRDEIGRTYTRRIAGCLNVVPRLLRRLPSLNVERIEFEEESWWDKRERAFEVSSRNLTWNSLVSMKEKSNYRPLLSNPNWTHFIQEGSITIHGLGKLGCLLEMFGKRFLTHGAMRSINVTERLLQDRADKFTRQWYSEFLLA